MIRLRFGSLDIAIEDALQALGACEEGALEVAALEDDHTACADEIEYDTDIDELWDKMPSRLTAWIGVRLGVDGYRTMDDREYSNKVKSLYSADQILDLIEEAARPVFRATAAVAAMIGRRGRAEGKD